MMTPNGYEIWCALCGGFIGYTYIHPDDVPPIYDGPCFEKIKQSSDDLKAIAAISKPKG